MPSGLGGTLPVSGGMSTNTPTLGATRKLGAGSYLFAERFRIDRMEDQDINGREVIEWLLTDETQELNEDPLDDGLLGSMPTKRAALKWASKIMESELDR